VLKNHGCHFLIAQVIKPTANQFEALIPKIKDRRPNWRILHSRPKMPAKIKRSTQPNERLLASEDWGT